MTVDQSNYIHQPNNNNNSEMKGSEDGTAVYIIFGGRREKRADEREGVSTRETHPSREYIHTCTRQ